MAEVINGVSTLPGAIHTLPDGTMCDQHSDRPAVKRVQGETDSMGCELNDMCAECYEEYKKDMREADTSGTCEWCHQHASKLRNRRDLDEGLYGRVYLVCDSCIKKENESLAEEADRYESESGYLDDDYDDDDDYGED